MTSYYLKEDGSGLLLLEQGGYYLLENAPAVNSFLLKYAPQNFALAVNGLSVMLTWTPIGSSLVTGYYVWRDGAIFATLTGNGISTYIDTAVIAGHRYAYAVSAFDLSQNYGPQTPTLLADVLQGNTLTFESVYQLQPGEGGYPDILWRWQ